MISIIVKLSLYTVMGALIAAVNIWYVRSLVRSFRAPPDSRTIAPFQIVGKKEEGSLGGVLAHMLAARLESMQSEMEVTASALRQAAPVGTGKDALPQDLSQPRPLSLGFSGTPLPPIDVKMAFAGVELSGLIAWTQRVFNERHGLRLSVNYEGDNAVIVGEHDGLSGSLWIQCSGSNQDIVNSVAYTLAYRHFCMAVSEAKALTPTEFRTLLTALDEAGQLNSQLASGRLPDPAQYSAISDKLDGIVKKTPRWRALIHVAAEIAENSRNVDRALGYYQLEQGLIPKGSQTKEAQQKIDHKVHRLKREVEERMAEIASRSPRGLPAATHLPDATTPSGRVLQLINATSLEMTGTPRVAVIGAPPPTGVLSPDQLEVIGSKGLDAQSVDPFLEEYTATVIDAVLLVAPKTRFVIAVPSHSSDASLGDADILECLNSVVGANPDIILMTFGPLTGAVYAKVFDVIASRGILAVLAAGNEAEEPCPFAGTPLIDRVIVASAIDHNGLPADFTQQDPKSFWAPGTGIPVQARGHHGSTAAAGKVDLRNGTTYAAAIAAGVASRILAEKTITCDEVIDLLRKTSSPKAKKSDHSDGPPILNLEAALKALR